MNNKLTVTWINTIITSLSGHYAVGEYIQEVDVSKRLRLMKQDIYYEYVPIITRKGSPYMEKLNKLILCLVGSGVILKWEDQVSVSCSSNNIYHPSNGYFPYLVMLSQ